MHPKSSTCPHSSVVQGDELDREKSEGDGHGALVSVPIVFVLAGPGQPDRSIELRRGLVEQPSAHPLVNMSPLRRVAYSGSFR